ncbi:MAG: histone deacetylase [Anaerolineaceae bacterium]|nr:histone deacetylase [Anaerolineaceae bacterium]
MTTAYITHARYSEHHLAGHPEHAGRIRAVWAELDKTGLSTRMQQLEARPASDEQILSVHTAKYLQVLHWIEQNPPARGVHHLDPDTYAGPTAFEIAKLSAGGVIQAVDEVLSGRANNALAAVRPPGHHAMPEHAMGFCLLGNVPIATRYAQKQFGVECVMIVDYDVHHGNGTEAMLYDDPTTLFISSHQYPFYPGTGALTDTGTGKGTGYTINIPLAAGHGDGSYAAFYEQIIWPAAERFKPELIIVSAGFDAHWLDPIAGMRLSLTGYAHLSRELIKMADQYCGGKIVFAMEGGYNLDALSQGMVNIGHALLSEDTVSDPLGPPKDSREPDMKPLISALREIHRL